VRWGENRRAKGNRVMCLVQVDSMRCDLDPSCREVVVMRFPSSLRCALAALLLLMVPAMTGGSTAQSTEEPGPEMKRQYRILTQGFILKGRFATRGVISRGEGGLVVRTTGDPLAYGGHNMHDWVTEQPEPGRSVAESDSQTSFIGKDYSIEVWPEAEGNAGTISVVDQKGSVVYVKDPKGNAIPLVAKVTKASPVLLRKTKQGQRALVVRAEGATALLDFGAPWVAELAGAARVERWKTADLQICRSSKGGYIEFAVLEGSRFPAVVPMPAKKQTRR